MRCFIAVELPGETRAELQEMAGQLRRAGIRASWVRPENMHLTLRFLGDIDEDQVQMAGERLDRDCRGISPFSLVVESAGAFPNPRRPSVIWAGVGPLDGGLSELQAVTEQVATGIGLKPEKRPFRPHLTLARVRRPEEAGDVGHALAILANFRGEAFAVSGVTLFSSTLTPKGAVYKRIRECVF
ncbi:MAG TPA: RNA 2',3'-cyclic phosphodiesterase [Candidatus Hydrogenedentes bacterium]|nr:RNA 2',3'-cyclic phosphodiesterase [Candidatus Hydrogenedentota bacterium]